MPQTVSLVKEAKDFAAYVHKGQKKKYSNVPRMQHLENVVALINKLPEADDMLLAAGYLHDTLEKADITFNNLNEKFGPEIALLVLELTNSPEGNGIPRDQRLWREFERLSRISYRAKLLKYADRIDNVRLLTNVKFDSKERYLDESWNLYNCLNLVGHVLDNTLYATLVSFGKYI
jgi:(p)ppGpp synthase/HD superfamily hydrolase